MTLALALGGLSPPVEAAKLPPLLARVEAKYKAAPTVMAEFTQVTDSALLKQRKESSGVITIKRPAKMRWETQAPDPSLFITDGKTMWFYTPPFEEGESGQLVVQKASQYLSRLAGALLSGDFAMGKELKIRAVSKSVFSLTPKAGTAGDIQTAELSVNPATLLIEKVVLKHQGGNQTEIRLGKIALGRGLGEELFRFEPPPNTDVVKR